MTTYEPRPCRHGIGPGHRCEQCALAARAMERPSTQRGLDGAEEPHMPKTVKRANKAAEAAAELLRVSKYRDAVIEALDWDNLPRAPVKLSRIDDDGIELQGTDGGVYVLTVIELKRPRLLEPE